MGELKLEFSRRLPRELMNGVAKGPQSQKRDNSESDPPQTSRDDSLSIIITPETEFDTEQVHTSNREHSETLRPSLMVQTLIGGRGGEN